MCDQENCREFKIGDIANGLFANLWSNQRAATLYKFQQLTTNTERVSFANDLLKKHKLLLKFVRQDKDDGLSAKYRQEGNEAFKKKDDLAACKLYTKSIAHAKSNGECLSLAYANRSAVFYEKKMYKQCLEDITKAFEHNYPKNLHDKLVHRQHRARQFLSTQQPFKYYEVAASISRPSKTIQCASACVEIRRSTVSGRQVVALDRIKAGDVIAVEKPYACLLFEKHLCTHCSFCLELCYNLLPCENCVYAMFCSPQCRNIAWTQYHSFECPILADLYALNMPNMHIALRISIMAKEHYKKIDRYAAKINDTYKSQHYEEIHFLETNTHLRSIDNLFLNAIIAAVLRNLMTNGSSFHQHLDDPKRDITIFDELMMRHFQTSSTNFHAIYEDVEEESYLPNLTIGVGAYAFHSLFNHSCTPNVIRRYHGSEFVLRAIRPIAKGDELVDNYGCHFAIMEKTERQRKLRENYFFDCACEACKNNWPLYENMANELPKINILKLQKLASQVLPVQGTAVDGREKAAILDIDRFLDDYNQIPEEILRSHNKFMYEMATILQMYYTSIGNKRPKF